MSSRALYHYEALILKAWIRTTFHIFNVDTRAESKPISDTI